MGSMPDKSSSLATCRAHARACHAGLWHDLPCAPNGSTLIRGLLQSPAHQPLSSGVQLGCVAAWKLEQEDVPLWKVEHSECRQDPCMTEGCQTLSFGPLESAQRSKDVRHVAWLQHRRCRRSTADADHGGGVVVGGSTLRGHCLRRGCARGSRSLKKTKCFNRISGNTRTYAQALPERARANIPVGANSENNSSQSAPAWRWPARSLKLAAAQQWPCSLCYRKSPFLRIACRQSCERQGIRDYRNLSPVAPGLWRSTWSILMPVRKCFPHRRKSGERSRDEASIISQCDVINVGGDAEFLILPPI